MNNLIKNKIERFKISGYKPKVLDLFAGCGGISLGFHLAGFEITGAIEYDADAVRTHAINFHDGSHPHSIPIDITTTDPEELVDRFGLISVEESIDVIVGGPPCQAFARVGRAKLREIAEHPEAFLNDPRSNLYIRYIQYVKAFKPVAILMENVPDILNYGGHNIAEEICETLSDLGYNCGYTLLNSAFYGVPQMRERMILIGYAKELDVNIIFPQPSNFTILPIGYKNSRNVALKTIQKGLFKSFSYFHFPPEATNNLKPAVTAEQALNDLPKITEHLEGKMKRGARRFTNLIPYPNTSKSLDSFAILMRNWPGFENRKGILDHVIRYLPRDYQIFARMNPGDQYPEAFQLALKLFKAELNNLEAAGKPLDIGSMVYEALKKKFVPPYDPGKFPNKWRKMEPDMPARTLMAHLGKDGYSHIHYDSTQARTISVREAARLQSFPDGFVFSGTMNPAFKQIGNAVPPLLAKAVAEVMFNNLTSSVNVEENSNQEVNSL